MPIFREEAGDLNLRKSRNPQVTIRSVAPFYKNFKCPTWFQRFCYDVIRLWYNGYEEKYNASGMDIARKKFPL